MATAKHASRGPSSREGRGSEPSNGDCGRGRAAVPEGNEAREGRGLTGQAGRPVV